MKMRGYAHEESFLATHIQELKRATRLVSKLPGRDRFGRYVRCHELVRALKPYLAESWHLIDGHVGPVEHTWLHDVLTFVVLDLYTPTRLPQVQLVDVGIHFQRKLYVPGERRRDVRWAVVRDLQKKLRRAR